MSIRRIAVSTDFSEESCRAFPAAAALARRFSADLDAERRSRPVLHVVHLAGLPYGDLEQWPAGSPIIGEDDIARYHDALAKRLDELVASRKEFEGLTVRPHIVRESTLEAYSRYLRDEKIDLLVLASRGRTGLTRVLLGSFAERVLRHATCPVLVFRDSGDGAPASDFALRRVLVPSDLSPSSKPAMDLAIEFACTFGARTRLYHVIEYEPGIYGLSRDIAGNWREYEEEVRSRFSRTFVEFIEKHGDTIDADFDIRKGNPVKEILREAEEFQADLVIMGTHGRTGWDRFFLGSISEQVVRRATCPVLVAPADGEERI